MDISKVMLTICALVLVVCLVLCITTLCVLRNAVAENGTVQKNATLLVDTLDDCVQELNGMVQKEDSVEVSARPEEDTADSSFYLRAVEGGVGVFTTEGYLVTRIDISIDTLPPSAREELKNGIRAESWQDLLKLIRDYTS